MSTIRIIKNGKIEILIKPITEILSLVEFDHYRSNFVIIKLVCLKKLKGFRTCLC